MPVENLEEEGLPKNPNLELAAWRFTITNPDGKDKEEAKKRLLDAIKENGMFCSTLCLVMCQHACWSVYNFLSFKHFLAIKLPLPNSAKSNTDFHLKIII